MFIRDVKRSGRRFAGQIFRCAKMILRNRCSTSYDLGPQLGARLSISEGSLAELLRFLSLMSLASKIGEVWQLLCF